MPAVTVSPANYLRYLSETAWDWGDAVGLGVNDSQILDLFWVIRETEIRFLRPLLHHDVFDFTIWLVNWQRVRGTRCFELKRKDNGEVVAQGTQQVVCMDSKTGRPVSLPEDVIDRFRLENPRVFPFERFPKITPAETPHITQRQVEWMDLDVYEHVNNAVYFSYAEEAAAQAFSARGWSPVKLAEANLTIATRRCANTISVAGNLGRNTEHFHTHARCQRHRWLTLRRHEPRGRLSRGGVHHRLGAGGPQNWRSTTFARRVALMVWIRPDRSCNYSF